MTNILEGKTIRDQILAKIQKDIRDNGGDFHLAVITIGDNAVCQKYVSLKKKLAEQCGIMVSVYCFNADRHEHEILETIEYMNNDPEINGVMIQIPVAKGFDQEKLIKAIAPEKDVDGLRYCLGEKSSFVPPVVLAIAKAIEVSRTKGQVTSKEEVIPAETGIQDTIDIDSGSRDTGRNDKLKSVLSNKKIVLVGEGFLVGGPLKRYLKENDIDVHSIHNIDGEATEQLKSADIVISAVGKAGLIKPEIIKDDVVLIDAGTSESNGELKGDIDPECYKKAAFYTPVPGGIGPLTVAFLISNLVHQV